MARTVVTTITAPASSFALIDLATLKSDLGVTITADDAFLTRLIARASTAISQFCNRVLVAETLSDSFSAGRSSSARMVLDRDMPLQLSRWPVIELGAVIENGTTLTVGVDFLLDGPSGQLTRIDADGARKPWLDAPISVAYSAGYDPIPDDIVDACEKHVLSTYMARGRDPALKTETLVGVFQAQYFGDQAKGMANIMDVLAPTLSNYRVPVIA
jgi:hypothetical protein